MPRGKGEITILELEVLQKFVETWTAPPELVLSKLFPESDSPSSSIKWESKVGGRGMTPFVPPGAPAPVTYPYGVAQHTAEAAYWKEKMSFDEEFLNNLRKEGTEKEYLSAASRLARELGGLVNRAYRRKEWMYAKMLFNNGFSYLAQGGVKITVDYGIDTNHIVTLGTDYKWSTGTQRAILDDIVDGKKKVKEACGGMVDWAVCNSTVLKYLARDPDLLTLLSKSHYGEGDLFKGGNNIIGVNPNVIAALLDIKNLLVYDEQYEVRAYITAAVTGSSTTAISVDDVTDFEVGGTLRFHDVSAGTYEDETISAVTPESGTVTVSSAPTASFKAGEDYVTMAKYFIPDDKFAMFASAVEGQGIAEYKRAPYGEARHYGLFTDKKAQWDPEVVHVRVQDKGLPILFQRDAVYILDVA